MRGNPYHDARGRFTTKYGVGLNIGHRELGFSEEENESLTRVIKSGKPSGGWNLINYISGDIGYCKNGENMFTVSGHSVKSTKKGLPYAEEYVKSHGRKGYFDYPADIRENDTKHSAEEFEKKYSFNEPIDGGSVVSTVTSENKKVTIEENDGFQHDENVAVMSREFHVMNEDDTEVDCEYEEIAIYGEMYYRVINGVAKYPMSKTEYAEMNEETLANYAEDLKVGNEEEEDDDETMEEVEYNEWKKANGLF